MSPLVFCFFNTNAPSSGEWARLLLSVMACNGFAMLYLVCETPLHALAVAWMHNLRVTDNTICLQHVEVKTENQLVLVCTAPRP